jgi:Ca-activated chloride channel homolog
MAWQKPIGIEEYVFIVAFAVLYGLYLYRIVRISKALKTDYKKVFVKVFLRTGYFSLLVVALLGPSFGDSKREVQSIGKDIFLVVDISESMNAFDIQPSRLERVKFELKNIVNSFGSDRIGLIIFSSEAFLQCPLTFDKGAITLFIEALHTGLIPRSGTDFGPALQLALEKLQGEESIVTQPKSKIVILISDGEDFGDQTAQVARKLSENNITLFTMGVGTQQGSRIRAQNGFRVDRDGQPIVTRLDSRQLKSLAMNTGGKYFEINESVNDVERLINSIKQIDGELLNTIMMDVTANKYYYFLALALLLMMADYLITVKPIRI